MGLHDGVRPCRHAGTRATSTSAHSAADPGEPASSQAGDSREATPCRRHAQVPACTKLGRPCRPTPSESRQGQRRGPDHGEDLIAGSVLAAAGRGQPPAAFTPPAESRPGLTDRPTGQGNGGGDPVGRRLLQRQRRGVGVHGHDRRWPGGLGGDGGWGEHAQVDGAAGLDHPRLPRLGGADLLRVDPGPLPHADLGEARGRGTGARSPHPHSSPAAAAPAGDPPAPRPTAPRRSPARPRRGPARPG
jgi:hypothetical protein